MHSAGLRLPAWLSESGSGAAAIRDAYTVGVKIYTRRGDAGETDLFGGPRVGKDDPRVEAYGAVDELNAFVGLCAATTTYEDLRSALRVVQEQLLDLGADLASADSRRRERDGAAGPRSEHVVDLENQHRCPRAGARAAQAVHPSGRDARRRRRFTWPAPCAGGPSAALVELHRDAPVSDVALRYLNRLSDLLFVMARVENRRAGEPDVEWGAATASAEPV